MEPTKAGLWTAGVSPACRPEAGGPAPGGPGEVRRTGLSPASPLASGGAHARWRSRGYLPRFDSSSLVQHVVFRLADSLPVALQKELDQVRRDNRVLATDAALDQGHGRQDLAVPAVAELVQTALLVFDSDRYALIAWCAMPNHVHALLAPCPGSRLDRIVHSLKSYTAKEANRVLRRSDAFWAREYFDRFMRDSDHLARTAAYIDGNPVKAGLCESVSDWRFSSAWEGWGQRDARGPATADEIRSAGLRPTCRRDAGGPDFR